MSVKQLPEKQIIKNIQNGASINSQAKKYDVTWDRIKQLCKKNNVASKHKSRMVTDDELLAVIGLNKVMTKSEIIKKLEISSYNNLARRLRQLIMEGKLQTIILPHTKTKYKNARVLNGYTGNHLFYVSNEELCIWAENRIPRQMPQNLRRAITRNLNDAGIHIKISKPSAQNCPVAFPKEDYQKLKLKAEKEGLTMREMILNYVLHE